MDAQCRAVPSQPGILACDQKQEQHMKGNNTVSCCLHSTELVQPAHLDTLRLPRVPLDPTSPLASPRTSLTLGYSTSPGLPASLCSPKLQPPQNSS